MRIDVTAQLPAPVLRDTLEISNTAIDQAYDPANIVFGHLRNTINGMYEAAAFQVRGSFRIDAYPDLDYATPEQIRSMDKYLFDKYLQSLADQIVRLETGIKPVARKRTREAVR